MRHFVIGATVGRDVVSALLERGTMVRALVRDPENERCHVQVGV